MTLYKLLDAQGGDWTAAKMHRVYRLPVEQEDGTWKPGEWMNPIRGDLVMFKKGYHLTDGKHLLSWMNARLFRAEYKGDTLEAPENGENWAVCARRIRLLSEVETWNGRMLLYFACDCIGRILPVYEAARPGDNRPRLAGDAVRRFADGLATLAELQTAEEAAWKAAREANGAARQLTPGQAGGQTVSVSPKEAATIAARIADLAAGVPADMVARIVANETAWALAGKDAGAGIWLAQSEAVFRAEREWQGQCLLHYVLGGDESL